MKRYLIIFFLFLISFVDAEYENGIKPLDKINPSDFSTPDND